MEIKLKSNEDVTTTVHENEETAQNYLTNQESQQEPIEYVKEDYGEKPFDVEDSPYVQTDIHSTAKMTESEFYKSSEMKRYRSSINMCCVIAYFSGVASIFGGLALYMMGWSIIFFFTMILSALIMVIPAVLIQTKRIFGCAIFMLVISVLNMVFSLFQGQISGIVPLIISINLTINLNEYRKHWKEYRGY